MIKKLNEAKALIDAGKYEEAKAKIDEVIAATPAEANDNGKGEKPTVGGGGIGMPNEPK